MDKIGMIPMEPGSLVMERNMVQGIKRRAERSMRTRECPRPGAAKVAAASFALRFAAS
jgi:hypothetical protein